MLLFLIIFAHSGYSTTSFSNCSNGEVRLVGGANILEGRVEVCINSAWGTVCSDGFGTNDAEVICRQTSYPYNSQYQKLEKK